MRPRLSPPLSIAYFAMTLAHCLVAPACIDSVPLEGASCPCLGGYVCCDGVCAKACEGGITASDLEGRKYILSFGNSHWIEPPGLGAETGSVGPVFAFEILDVDPLLKTFTALLGTMANGEQNSCNKTYRLPGTLENADATTFRLGPKTIQTILVGPETKTLASYYGFTLTGQFTDRGARYTSGTLESEMDAREIYTIFNINQPASGEELCEMMSEIEMDCQECSFEPGTPLCLMFRAEGFSVSDSPDMVLREIPEFDADCI